MTFKQRMSSARKLLKPMKPIVRTYGVVPASRASKRRKKRGVRVIGVRVTRASGGVDVMFIMHTLMGSCKPSLIGRHQKWLPQLWTCLWMLSLMPCALMMNMPAGPLQSQSGFKTAVIPKLQPNANPNVDCRNVDGDIEDIQDCVDYQQHELFSQYDDAIAMQAYMDGFNFENPIGVFRNLKGLMTVYAANLNLPAKERYLSDNLLIVSVCFVRVFNHATALKVLGGDPTNPNCSSLGGALRRMWPPNLGPIDFEGE